MMPRSAHKLAALVGAVLLASSAAATAQQESCITQSAMPAAERTALSDAARRIAAAVVANDAGTLRTSAAPELTKDLGALQYLVATTAPKLAGDAPVVDQVYVLDATGLKPATDGSSTEAQFYCSLNRTSNEVEFDIPSLPPGRYGFAIVNLVPGSGSVAAWRLSLLLRQQPAGSGPWLLAGLYPRALTTAGHDGLWYWTQARQMAQQKQPWNAWLYYREAQRLLQPADFVVSTHLEKLRSESAAAAPPTLSDGIGPDAPLVVKGVNGAEYHFTSLSAEDASAAEGQSVPANQLDVVVHFNADPLPDQNAARQRNLAASAALLTAYPELRKVFHGIAVYADSANQPSYRSAFTMADVR
jgi:hypothetical protein